MSKAAIISLILGQRRAITALVCLLTVVALGFATQVRFDGSMDKWFLEDDPGLATYERFLQTFGADELTVMGVFAEDVFTPAGLAEIDRLTRGAEAAPFVRRVTSITNLDAATEEDGAIVTAPLVPALPATQAEAEAIRARVLANRLLTEGLVAADGTAIAVLVELDPAGGNFTGKRAMTQALTALAAGAPPGLEVHLAGTPVLDSAILDYTLRDVLVIAPATGLLIFLTTFLIFRRRSAAIVPLVIVGLACIWLVGYMGARGIHLNLISIGLIPLMLAVGIANAVHFIADYYRRLVGGLDRDEAVRESLDHLLTPCFFTSMTTVAGFLSLGISDLAAVQEFGNLAAVGVAFAFVLSMGFIPSLLRLVHVPDADYIRRQQSTVMARLLARLSRPRLGPSRAILALTLPLVALSVWGLSTLEASASSIGYLPAGSPVRTAIERIDDSLGGSTSYELLIHAPDEGLKDPEILARLAELEAWMAQIPQVTGVVSVLGPLRETRRLLAGGAPEEAILPDSRGLAAELYLFLESSDRLGILVQDDYSLGRMTARAKLSAGHALAAWNGAIQAKLEEGYRTEDLDVELTGFITLTGNVEAYLIDSQIKSFVAAFLVITALMFLLLRSVTLGIFSMIPNLLPIVMGLGFMAVVGIHLDPGTVMIGSIALGLVVDDTVHFLVRLRDHEGRGASLEDAIARTMQETGRPIIVTSLALAAGFSVMALGSFSPNIYFGIISAVVILLALLCALVLLPAALLVFRPRALSEGPPPRQ